MTGCLLCSFHHFLVGGVGIAVENIFFNGAIKDVVLLEHETNVLAQELGVVFTQVDAV